MTTATETILTALNNALAMDDEYLPLVAEDLDAERVSYLRDEAHAAGDHDMVNVCTAWLVAHDIMDQMNDDDRAAFTRAGWAAGVSNMCDGGEDEGAILDEIEAALGR